MKRDYHLIVFDWDGTLMDSVAKIVRCFTEAVSDVGLVVPDEAAIRNVIGLGLQEALQVLLPDADDTARARVIDRYREHFLHLDETEMVMFPGVPEGLEALTQQGYLLAVATGKARRGLDRVLRETATAHFFAATRCAGEAPSKPHPRMLQDILDQTGVVADRALMVGDTIYDLQMAQGVGMDSLAVSYGVHERELLLEHEPVACLDSFHEVCRWLQ